MKNKKGFTLLELLVVVLIIGILAGIALPQYKMLVCRTKFSTLKNTTKSLVESVQRYYLANDAYPKKHTDLDISYDGMEQTYADINQFNFSTSAGLICFVMTSTNNTIGCSKEISGKRFAYHVNRETNKPIYCISYSKNTSDFANRLCQKETGKKQNQGDCSYTYYCLYSY